MLINTFSWTSLSGLGLAQASSFLCSSSSESNSSRVCVLLAATSLLMRTWALVKLRATLSRKERSFRCNLNLMEGGSELRVSLYSWMNTLTVPATHWASKLLRTASAELILAFITSSTSPEMKDCAVATLAVSLSYTRKEKE